MRTAESAVLRVLIIIVLIPLAKKPQAMKGAERLNLYSNSYSFTAKNSVISHTRSTAAPCPILFAFFCEKGGKVQPVEVPVQTHKNAKSYDVNDVPHPQELFAFGLIKLNPCRMIVSS